MSLLLWFLAACGSTPTTIGGDAELVIWEVSPFSVDAPGLDAEGKAIEGAKVGDVVSYTAPNGKQIEVKILETTPYDV